MGRISFNEISNDSNGSNDFKVSFFSLKNDGDEATVRILHDNVDSFDLLVTHPIKIGENYRRVNCIRDPHEPMDNCPLCKSGAKIQQRMYIHLIQYVNDEQGNIVPKGKIWERPASYAVAIKNLIDEYGPLSDCIFKIRRNGVAGSKDTTYSIMFANPAVYRPEYYPKDTSLFDGYSVVGSAVMDKSFEEIAQFVATGAFPDTKKNDNAMPVAPTPMSAVVPQSDYNPVATPSMQMNAPANITGYAQVPVTPPPQYGAPNMDNLMPPTSVNRPVRHY